MSCLFSRRKLVGASLSLTLSLSHSLSLALALSGSNNRPYLAVPMRIIPLDSVTGTAMGAGASAVSSINAESIKQITLKSLPDAIEESVYVYEKFPLVIDPTEQASRFLKYQTGAFLNFDDPTQSSKSALNRALTSSMLNGRTMTLKIPSLRGLQDSIFDAAMFPKEIIDRMAFFDEAVWKPCLKPAQGDPLPEDASISSEFAFIIVTADEKDIPSLLVDKMHIIRVVDKANEADGGSAEVNSCGDSAMDQIASMFGASEIIRNSPQLVEAAFDGDLEELQNQIQKGFHIESHDGRKHTALSEAACQGHLHVVQFLLTNGADPNALNDTGRSALWRASFNGHVEVVRVLLESGANPQFRDRVSMESAYDVATKEDVQQLLSEWDISRTERLMEERRRVILANLESRIKTSAEREALARNLIRKELVEKAENGDVDGIRQLLDMIAQEAEQSKTKPRATVEVRNDLGQSLLSIATQHDDEALATFLLTHWKTLDADRWDLTEGEISPEAKIFKANPNSRDLKGWTCVCIAVFHNSRKVLKLLLEHGGDPNIRSSYNKNAWDLARDELDAAEKVVKSNAEIRQVLIDHDRTNSGAANYPALFAKCDVVKTGNGDLYAELDKDGSPVVMNIEMNNALAGNACPEPKKKGNGKSASGGSKPSAGKPKAAKKK